VVVVMEDQRTMRPGDRVEIAPGRQFGIVLATRPTARWDFNRGIELLVRMPDGTEQWLQQFQAWYAPPTDIVERHLEEIQSAWSTGERMSRSGYQSDREVVAPVVQHDEWDAAIHDYMGEGMI